MKDILISPHRKKMMTKKRVDNRKTFLRKHKSAAELKLLPLALAAIFMVPGASVFAQTATSAVDQAAAKKAAEEAEDAPTKLETVVVRSRNRIERLQDVPLSISVVSGQELERLQALDVGAITKRVGNVVWNPGNPRQFSLSIRGVGKQAQTDAQDPSVGIIVDGVNYAYNPLSSSVDFTDIAAVEVTRGPQGTLVGKNTSLGVINITTRKPTFESEASGQISYGERQNLFATSTIGGAGIYDFLAWRGTFFGGKGRGGLGKAFNPGLTYAHKNRFSGR